MPGDLALSGNQLETFVLIVAGGAILSIILIFLALRSLTSGPQQKMRERISRAKRANSPKGDITKPMAGIRLSDDYSSIKSLDMLLRRFLPRPALLRQRLAKTGGKMSVGTFVLINVVLAAAIAGATNYFFKLPVAPSILLGVAIGMGVPHVVVSHLIARRLKKFVALFPESIDLIVRGLKSGLPVTESIKSVGAEFADPVGIEFRGIADAIKFGKTIDEALWDATERLDTAEFKFFVISLSIQQETGGNLTETLQNLSDILRKRRQMRLKIKAMSSEARASAMIIGALPFIMFGIIMMLNRDYIMTLFIDPRGMVMVGFVLALMLMGFFVMYKMVRFEI